MSGLNERTKRRIALLAGDDLEEEEVAEIRELIASCPDCRRFWVRVRGCLDILERSGSCCGEEMHDAGLWPGIETRLRPAVAPARTRKFNGWVPALSMAAACIAMLVAGQMDATWQHDGNWPAASDRLAGGIHQVGWMPISQEKLSSAQFAPISPPVTRVYPASYESGITPVGERVIWPVLDKRLMDDIARASR